MELEGVAVAVAGVALEELDFGLSDLLEIAAVLEHLFPMERLLGHVLYFVDMPWMVARLHHCLHEVKFHVRIERLQVVLVAVVQEENVHHSIHLADELLAVGIHVLRVLHHLVEHRMVHNHHLLLDHRSLPIELVEYGLEGLCCIRVSKDLVRTELEHR